MKLVLKTQVVDFRGNKETKLQEKSIPVIHSESYCMLTNKGTTKSIKKKVFYYLGTQLPQLISLVDALEIIFYS